VLIYRENYGGEIDYPAFRKQFRGKQRPQELVLGRSIQNISGATISVRSMTLATRDLLSLFARLNPDIRRISE
ncbi:MAG: FMN-binding protein, partial [Calditrichaeota bacterium]|nr:FMN-binding protein [Calditrichota bacterium]